MKKITQNNLRLVQGGYTICSRDYYNRVTNCTVYDDFKTKKIVATGQYFWDPMTVSDLRNMY